MRVIPVTTDATGRQPRLFQKDLQEIPHKHFTAELQGLQCGSSIGVQEVTNIR
jgi:hypothetical protein